MAQEMSNDDNLPKMRGAVLHPATITKVASIAAII